MSRKGTIPNYSDFSRSYDYSSDSEDQPLLSNTKTLPQNDTSNALHSSVKALLIFSVAAIAVTGTVSVAFSSQSTNSSPVKQSTNNKVKPNFVFILADDVGWNSIGYQNYDLAFATPYMTELAGEGIVLTNYYSQEVCTPARASLLTGRYPFHVGLHYGVISPQDLLGLNTEETLLPQVLKEQGGYTNYIIGKWNLGHYSQEYLPTARGFDYFLGYLDGHNYYWSKRDPEEDAYYDCMIADTSCYNLYDGDDISTYSTQLYASKAITAIKAHDFDTSPMFMYLPFQAAHNPFSDYNDTHPNGVDSDLVGKARYKRATTEIVGVKRQQYAMSLMLLDDAINDIVTALTDIGQMDNTYLIFTSDNGGCFEAGGKNGPLRGSKGTLYEGGTKVDAFIYSPLLSKYAGSTYTGIMHVSDWFPTMLSWAGLTYTADDDYQLDGIDHSTALISNNIVTARENMVYNIYLNVSRNGFDLNSNAPVAVRNGQYKLIHAFTGNKMGLWYEYSDIVSEDDDLESCNACSQAASLVGSYNKFLFDLVNDPYETTNLYGLSEYSDVQDELNALMYKYASTVTPLTSATTDTTAETFWSENGNFIQPWTTYTGSNTVPKKCTSNNVFSS